MPLGEPGGELGFAVASFNRNVHASFAEDEHARADFTFAHQTGTGRERFYVQHAGEALQGIVRERPERLGVSEVLNNVRSHGLSAANGSHPAPMGSDTGHEPTFRSTRLCIRTSERPGKRRLKPQPREPPGAGESTRASVWQARRGDAELRNRDQDLAAFWTFSMASNSTL